MLCKQISLLLCVIFLFACRGRETNPSAGKQAAYSSPNPKDSIESAAQFFPVASYLMNEIEYVDSLPVGIVKYRSVGRKTDSSYISLDEFHGLASEFISPELNDSNFRKGFQESSFMDRSTSSATFFYKSLSPSQNIKRVDVVTAKGDVFDEVKSIYIEKQVKQGNEVVNKKLFWKPKRNFQIITVNEDHSDKQVPELVKVVWDNRD
jgi:hypothetical protein